MLKMFGRILAIFTSLLLVSCATTPPPKVVFEEKIQRFEPAIHEMASRLKDGAGIKKGAVVIDAFFDINNHQTLKVNNEIEDILISDLSPAYMAERLKSASLQEVDYVISGVIAFESFRNKGKAYHIYASLYERVTGKILSVADVWVDTIVYQPYSIYKCSPIALSDKVYTALFNSVRLKPGEMFSKDYIDFLQINSILTKGDMAFEEGKFEDAAGFYKRAEDASKVKMLRIETGLYCSYDNSKNPVQTEERFKNIVRLSIEEFHKLEVKFLFDVNSALFVKNETVAHNYAMWLREIARHLERSRYCVDIIGHSSCTGSEVFNDKLSLARAKMVQQVLGITYKDIPRRSTVEGKGFSENIVGSCTDDLRDLIDRRVEFKITECK